MTIPRRVLPHATYTLTRRCLDRRFYLRPSPRLNQTYLYALAHAQYKYGVQVHAFVAMSNHVHEVVTDGRGVLPEFMRDFRRDLALGVRVLHEIHQNVWSAEKPTAVELHGSRAEHEQVIYTLLNPVRARLVARVTDWPGAISLPGVREIEVRRPEGWFSDDRPDVLTLKITPPPSWTGTEDEWHEWLAAEVAKSEAELHRVRADGNHAVLGRRRVIAQSPFDRPSNPDEVEPSRAPTVATGGDGRLLQSVIASLRAWRRAYRAAFERWRRDKSARFPNGAWWVVRCAGAVAET